MSTRHFLLLAFLFTGSIFLHGAETAAPASDQYLSEAPASRPLAAPASKGPFRPVKVERLELIDGRVFEQVVITAENPTRVTLRHAGGMAQVDKTQLPEDLYSKFPVDESAAAQASERDARVRAQRNREQRARYNRVAAERQQSVSASQRESARRSSNAVNALDALQQKAQSAAENYFRTRWRPGTNAVYITDLAVTIDSIETAAGWEGHYNVRGSAYIEYYMSPGRTFTSQTREFDAVMVQMPGRNSFEVSVK